MSNFFINDLEARLFANILREELEAIEEDREDFPDYVAFVEDLLTAVKNGDNIMQTPQPRPPQVGNVVHVNFN
jgi:predicted DNA-binding protein